MRKGADDNLKAFAKRIETRLRAGMSGSDSLERLICRLMTNKKTPQVAALLAGKVVEWHYGKATEHVKVEGAITHTHEKYEHATDEQLRAAEESINALIESASDVGSN